MGETDDRQHRRPQALERYSQALEVSRQAGWPEGQAEALAKLGRGLFEAGRLLEANTVRVLETSGQSRLG